jgi:hypothetical protein
MNKKQISGRIFSKTVVGYSDYFNISFVNEDETKRVNLGKVAFVANCDTPYSCPPFEGRTHFWVTDDQVNHRTFVEARMHLFNRFNSAPRGKSELVQLPQFDLTVYSNQDW